MILLYHNILAHHRAVYPEYAAPGLPVQCFEQQLAWLMRYREVVGLGDYLKMKDAGKRYSRNLVALTFDDGLGSTFDRVYPLLASRSVPATFFVSTSHLQPGKLLWFSYLNALCFGSEYNQIEIDGRTFELATPDHRKKARRSLAALARACGNPKAFTQKLAATYPLSDAAFTEYQGMSAAQLQLLSKADLFECGAHTVNHPYLDKLSPEEQEEEIFSSKKLLGALTGKSVRYFAYPNGDYNHDTLAVLHRAGFEAAFATNRRRLGIDKRFEIERTGIYSMSFFKFWLKALGVVKAARRFGLSS